MRKKILIVEDDAIITKLYVTRLVAEGFQVDSIPTPSGR